MHEIGGPENLVYEDVPDPEPSSGEVIVKVRAAALNRRDGFVTQGMYPGAKPEALPVVLGADGSGEVVARGEGAGGPDEGTEVVINPALFWGDDPAKPGKEYRILGLPDDGTFAQLVKVPGDHVFPKPSHLSHEEAAAVPLAALTAYRALVTRGQVQDSDTVVIPGVGGGVATFLVQITVAIAGAVLLEASLSFLGLGTPLPAPSWGSMLSIGRGYLPLAPWYGIFPGLAITLLVMGLYLLGDGLRDALDPRRQKLN